MTRFQTESADTTRLIVPNRAKPIWAPPVHDTRLVDELQQEKCRGHPASLPLPAFNSGTIANRLSSAAVARIRLLFHGSRPAAERQDDGVYALVVDRALLSKNQCVAYATADDYTSN